MNKEKELQSNKPSKIKLGMFEGKYEMPPDELMYGDDISDLFEIEEGDIDEFLRLCHFN